MARAAIPGRLTWEPVEVIGAERETARVRSLRLQRPAWDFLPGQHVDLRLTAEDGYRAQRSYSIASAPEDDHLLLTVECLSDGEVSPYLHDEVAVGDHLEVRGPIGGYFVWEADQGGPLLLVAGGAGVVPFRSMLRHRTHARSDVPVRLLYSARTLSDVVYQDELSIAAAYDDVDVRLVLTRERSPGWSGYSRRVDAEMMTEVAWPPDAGAQVFVCGPSGFVEAVASVLVALGHDPGLIRTERFGPSGG